MRAIVVPVTGCLTPFEFSCKVSDETLDYTIDLWAWLAVNNLTLSNCAISVTDNLQVISQNFKINGLKKTGVSVELSGGIPGNTETVIFRFSFVEGRTLDVVVQLPIQTLPSGLQSTIPGTLAIGGMSLAVGNIVLADFTQPIVIPIISLLSVGDIILSIGNIVLGFPSA